MQLRKAAFARRAFRKIRSDQHDVILFCQIEILIGHHLAVLDGINACLGRVVRSGLSPAVRGEFESVAVRFGDHEPDVIHAVNILLIVYDDLDHQRAIMDIFADP